MLRGQAAIYNSLLPNPFEAAQDSATRKGRSEHLNRKRNEALICRYYFYVKHRSFQYITTLEMLEAEFFISKRTCVDILQQNRHLLNQLHGSKPSVKYFRDRYPHISWVIPAANPAAALLS